MIVLSLLAAACPSKVSQFHIPAVSDKCKVSERIAINEDSAVSAECDSRALVFSRQGCVSIAAPGNRRVDSIAFSWSSPFDDTKLAKWSLADGGRKDLLANSAGRMKKTTSVFKDLDSAGSIGFCFEGDNINGRESVYDWTLNIK